MATNPSSDSALDAWDLAIESLATIKQVDASVVTDLVKRTPGGPCSLGRGAMEMISFRVLESLCVPGTDITKNTSSSEHSDIGFNSPDSCLDVLHCFSQKISGSSLQDEKLRGNVQAFILQKRACLPKCTLVQLKDAFLQGSDQRLASLKERADLLLENPSESGIPANVGDDSGLPNEPEGSKDLQNIAANVNTANGDNLSVENIPGKNMVPTKRARSSPGDSLEKTTDEDQITVENHFNSHSDGAKKLKLDHTCVRKTLEPNIVSGKQLKDAVLQGSDQRLASLKERADLVLENPSESGIPANVGDASGLPNEIEGSKDLQNIAANVNAENGDNLSVENIPGKNMVPTKRARSSPGDSLEKTTDEDQITVENHYNSRSGKQLKDAILQGSDQPLASLKERANLILENPSEIGIPANVGDASGLPNEIEGSKDLQNFAANVNAENGDNVSVENIPGKNMVPTKRARSSAGDNLEKTTDEDQITVENHYMSHSDGAKKLKRDQNCVRKTLEPNIVSLHGEQPLDDITNIRMNTGTKGCEVPEEVQVIDVNKVANDFVHEEDTAFQTLGQNCDVDDDILHDPQEVDFDLKVHSSTSKEGETRSFCVIEECDASESSDAVGNTSTSEAKDEMESSLPADNIGYATEMSDIATKKHALLSSRDSSVCVHCNKGGQLLVCTSDACQFVIHAGCLKSAETFDSKGDFYCHFCAYTRLVSDFQDVQLKYSLARENLVAFISSGMKSGPTNFSKKSLEKTAQSLDKPSNKRMRDDMNQVVGIRFKENREVEQAGTSTCHAAPGNCSERKGKVVTSEKGRLFSKDKQEEEKVNQVWRSPRSLEGQQNTSQVACQSLKTDTHLEIPQLKRGLLWTKLEEDTLKEGVKRFQAKGSVPWTTILEYGKDVFQKGRKPRDLKSKWWHMYKQK